MAEGQEAAGCVTQTTKEEETGTIFWTIHPLAPFTNGTLGSISVLFQKVLEHQCKMLKASVGQSLNEVSTRTPWLFHTEGRLGRALAGNQQMLEFSMNVRLCVANAVAETSHFQLRFAHFQTNSFFACPPLGFLHHDGSTFGLVASDSLIFTSQSLCFGIPSGNYAQEETKRSHARSARKSCLHKYQCRD